MTQTVQTYSLGEVYNYKVYNGEQLQSTYPQLFHRLENSEISYITQIITALMKNPTEQSWKQYIAAIAPDEPTLTHLSEVQLIMLVDQLCTYYTHRITSYLDEIRPEEGGTS